MENELRSESFQAPLVQGLIRPRVNANAEQKARLLEARVNENAETINQLREERAILVSDHKTLQKRFAEITAVSPQCRVVAYSLYHAACGSLARGMRCLSEVP